jgi:hypothetical protein
MSLSKLFLVSITAASLAAVGFTLSVTAQDKPSLALGGAGQDKPHLTLGVNEGILVHPTNFAVMKGTAKSDPSAKIAKLGAREVSSGAIIFRVGDKLYLADADLGQKSLLNAFWEEYDRSHTP